MSAPEVRHRRRRSGIHGLRAALVTLGAGLTLTAWLYASPPGSSPDDGYHLGSIWCAGGFHPDRCFEAIGIGDPDFAIAPAVLSELTCVGGDGRQPATCINGVYERLEGQFRPIPANLTGVRASLYYRAANLLVSEDHAAAIARIRAMNAALALLMVGLTAAIAERDIRRAVLGSWLIASIPLGVFLLTSLNSTAWGLIGLGTLWANLMTAARPGRRLHRLAASVLALVGIAMALGARTEAGAHLLVIVLALIVLHATESDFAARMRSTARQRPFLIAGMAVGLAGVGTILLSVSGVGYLLGSSTNFTRGWDRLVNRGISNPVLTLAAETPQLWTGSLGTWSLGWLDTNMPSAVWVPMTASFVLLVAFGLLGASAGRSLAVTVIVLGMLVLPVASLLSVGLVVQEQLQARHYLPLLYVLAGFALIRSRGQSELHLSRGPRLVIAGALTLAHAVALTININRYARGLTEFLYVDTNREIAWWWGGWAPSPGVVRLVGTVAFGFVAFGVLSLFNVAQNSEGAASSNQRAQERT